ncbi:MAG: DUF3472 domain-containing protein [Proteobacteria bacterium]|nr:DUF3472 domain-containing protein [Pseudomonadota bacterium]
MTKPLHAVALMLWLLPLAGALDAAEVPAHIARGHLLAAFCGASPAVKVKQVTAIYREIIPVAAPSGSYTTVAFAGGYVGLAGNHDGTGGDTINFSIWGKDAKELEPADQKFGSIKTRQFTHEGTGWAGRLAYPWKVGTRYQVYVHVKHEEGHTVFSAWFGAADQHEWLLAGRTRKEGTHYLGHAGGFLEHAGTKDMQIPRRAGYGPAWVHDGQRWHACTTAEASVKDPENARFSQRDGVVYLELGLGLKSEQGPKHTYPMKVLSEEPPQLPEPATLSKS